jgi:hypothetical protein
MGDKTLVLFLLLKAEIHDISLILCPVNIYEPVLIYMHKNSPLIAWYQRIDKNLVFKI